MCEPAAILTSNPVYRGILYPRLFSSRPGRELTSLLREEFLHS